MSEALEQEKLFAWIRAKAKSSGGNWWKLKYAFATLNGIRLTIGQAAKAKRQGNTKGTPDCVIPARGLDYNGLFIEMKYGKNKQSKEQIDYQTYLNGEGYLSTVCYSANEAIKTIEKYLTMGEL